MADASKRKFDGVVVWKFDRFARSVSHLLRALEEFRATFRVEQVCLLPHITFTCINLMY
jgi:DNA invertase Pin-like site-specific DNA recombinase